MKHTEMCDAPAAEPHLKNDKNEEDAPMRLLTSLLLALFIAGCAKHQIHPDSTVEELEQLQSSGDESTVPRSSEGYLNFMFGEVAVQQGRYDEALKYFKKVDHYDPAPSAQLRTRTAQLYSRNGDFARALTEIDKGLAEDSHNITLLQLRGGTLVSLKRYPEAVAVYRQLISDTAPNNEEYYILLASLYIQQGERKQAEEVLKELVRAIPQSFLGAFYQGRLAEADSRPKDALVFYEQAEKYAPDPSLVRIEIARVYANTGKLNDASQLCEELLKDNPQNVQALQLLSQIRVRQNRLDDALKDFEALGALQDDPTDTRLKIALIKVQQQDFEGALSDLQLVLSSQPTNSSARYYLAFSLAALKQPQQAIAELEKIDPSAPNFVEARLFESYVQEQQGELKSALLPINDVLKAQPENLKVLFYKAYLERRLDLREDSIKTMRSILKLKPDSEQGLYLLALYLEEAGHREESLSVAREAVRIAPQNPDALNFLGYTLAEAGQDLNEAEQLVRRALEIDSQNGAYRDSLGWVYFKQGRYSEAVKELEVAVRKAPNDAVILEHYGQALLKLGREAESLKVF